MTTIRYILYQYLPSLRSRFIPPGVQGSNEYSVKPMLELHCFPPYLGSGWLQLRYFGLPHILLLFIWKQVLLVVIQSVQPPSTEKSKWLFFFKLLGNIYQLFEDRVSLVKVLDLLLNFRFKKYKQRCTRIENPGESSLNFLPKLLRGSGQNWIIFVQLWN